MISMVGPSENLSYKRTADFSYLSPSGLGTIFATAPRNTHRAYSGAAILTGYVVKCVIESSQRAPREL